jgi:hypothetical protein
LGCGGRQCDTGLGVSLVRNGLYLVVATDPDPAADVAMAVIVVMAVMSVVVIVTMVAVGIGVSAIDVDVRAGRRCDDRAQHCDGGRQCEK